MVYSRTRFCGRCILQYCVDSTDASLPPKPRSPTEGSGQRTLMYLGTLRHSLKDQLGSLLA